MVRFLAARDAYQARRSRRIAARPPAVVDRVLIVGDSGTTIARRRREGDRGRVVSRCRRESRGCPVMVRFQIRGKADGQGDDQLDFPHNSFFRG